MSCAYDGKIICWKYDEDRQFDMIVKPNQELRCMGAVTENGTLLVGTNRFTILTEGITEWVNFGRMQDGAFAFEEEEEEEEKYDAIEYGDRFGN